MRYQTPDSDDIQYNSTTQRILAKKNRMTIEAMIRGIQSEEEGMEYIYEEIDLAEREDREPRRWLIGFANQMIDDLEE